MGRWSLILMVADVAVCVLVICFNDYFLAYEKDDSMVKCLGKLLSQLSDSSKFNKVGALEWYKFKHEHLWWRLIACVWFHDGIIHFLVKILNLIHILNLLAKRFGFVTVGIVYLLAGFCWSILSFLLLGHKLSVGASSALFGLLGAMLSHLLHADIRSIHKAAALLAFIAAVVAIAVEHQAAVVAIAVEHQAWFWA